MPAMNLSETHQQTLLTAARTGIRDELRGIGQSTIPETNDPVLLVAAGCFVSLHESKTHRLRGCIGRLQSPEPLIKNIYASAHSVVHDARFAHNPVSIAELGRLDLEVSVLSPLLPAEHPLDFDLVNDGIYLMCAGRTGTFLPQVARQTGWSREQLLARLCTEKMGLLPTSWKDPSTKLLKYQAVVIGPVPFLEKGQVAPEPEPQPTIGFSDGQTTWVL